ncbi:MAG: hypothetical protein Q8L66_04965 [Caulobacter sp.]|nr:hypothetical protein [Caulobacter sp.]
MKVLRWVLGALALAYVGMSGLMAGLNALHKLGRLTTVPADLQRMVPLWDATPWWQLAVWGASLLLMLIVAWRLFTGGRAFGVYVLAVAANIAGWWFMQSQAAYQTVFTAAELQYDYYSIGALIVVGIIIWLTERGK